MARAASSEQENLQGEIAYLRMYSEVYRTHLRTYLEALLRNVDEWARAEQSPASVEHDEPQALTPIPGLTGLPAMLT